MDHHRPNTSIKRKINGMEITEESTEMSNMNKIMERIKRPQTAKINSKNIIGTNGDNSKLKKIDLRHDLENYMSNIGFNDVGVEPYVTPYTPKIVKIINRNAFIDDEIRTNYWKYEHLFPKPQPRKTGKLMQIITQQFFPMELQRQKNKNKKFEVEEDYFL